MEGGRPRWSLRGRPPQAAEGQAAQGRERENDTFKPDVDNIAKAVLDALNGVAFEDDSQVVRLRCSKHPRKRRESDRTLVRIWKEEL